MTLMLLSGFTASCGLVPGASQDSSAQNSSENTAQPQPSQSTTATTGNAVSIPPPVALPPSYGDRPNAPGTLDQPQTLPNGLPALHAKGVNVDDLFAQDISNTDQRFDRLENAVLDLRREFESFKPAIVRLVAVEADIQDLIEQLDILLQGEPASAPAPLVAAPTPLTPTPQVSVQDEPNVETPTPIVPTPVVPTPAAPEPAPAVVPPSTPAPVAAPTPEPAPPPAAATPPPSPQPAIDTSGPAAVSSIRVGEHSGKLRLVMDVNKKTPYDIDLDNQENILIIELPEARWSAESQKNFGSSPLLNAYTTESINDGKGTRVIMTLKKPTTLMKSEALPPGDNPYYRIYADLKT